MKLLGDAKYCIKVDYFHWDGEKDEEYTNPLYWCIDESPARIIIFRESIDDRLRVFDTEEEAQEYLESHTTGFNVCYENPRIVQVKYNFEENRWEEC